METFIRKFVKSFSAEYEILNTTNYREVKRNELVRLINEIKYKFPTFEADAIQYYTSNRRVEICNKLSAVIKIVVGDLKGYTVYKMDWMNDVTITDKLDMYAGFVVYTDTYKEIRTLWERIGKLGYTEYTTSTSTNSWRNNSKHYIFTHNINGVDVDIDISVRNRISDVFIKKYKAISKIPRLINALETYIKYLMYSSGNYAEYTAIDYMITAERELVWIEYAMQLC